MEAIFYAREALRSIKRKFVYPTGPFCSFRKPVFSSEAEDAINRLIAEVLMNEHDFREIEK